MLKKKEYPVLEKTGKQENRDNYCFY